MKSLVRQLSLVVILVLCVDAGANGQLVKLEGTTMGGIKFGVTVVTDDDQPENLQALKRAVNDSLQRVNQLMSTYLEDSDISKFNRSSSTQWQEVDPETATVVARALEIAKLTDGAFDPTVSPAVNAWNFGPGKKQQPKPPSEKQINELSKLVGFEAISVRLDPPSIRKSIPEAQLDLSAIAKGYAVDRVGESLREIGYENSMVVVGGEVYASGKRISGGPWNIVVEKPDSRPPNDPNSGQPEQGESPQQVVKLSDRAIATSGDYRNFYEFEGTRYSHTIDPETCMPVDHGMAVASVVADDCMTADAMATAVMVIGHEKGAALCERLGYPLLTIHSDDNTFVEQVSEDFPLSKNHVESLKKQTEVDSKPKPARRSSQSILPVFAATFLVFCLVVLGMAVGAIFNNKPVTGSCGGLANMTNEDGESVCGICSKPTADCDEVKQATV